MRIAGFKQQFLNVLERRRRRPEWIEAVEIEQLLVRFDRRQRHPVEREQEHDQDDRERQIKRDQPPWQSFEIAHAFGMIRGACGNWRRREELSHYSLRAAICGAGGRTTRSGWRRAEMESWRSRLPRLRPGSRRE